LEAKYLKIEKKIKMAKIYPIDMKIMIVYYKIKYKGIKIG